MKFQKDDRRLRGKTLVNPHGQCKIAFVPRRYSARVMPKPGQVWQCALLSDSDPDSVQKRGCLEVAPIRCLSDGDARCFKHHFDRVVQMPNGPMRIFFHQRLRMQIVLRPEKYPLIREALKKLGTLQMKPRQTVETLLDSALRPDIVRTPRIDEDTVSEFAKLSGYEHPVRILRSERFEPSQRANLRIRLESGGPVLERFNIGAMQMIEPTQATRKELFLDAMRFWNEHAHVYHPEMMSEPYPSTWNEVLDELKPKPIESIKPGWEPEGPLLLH